MRPGWNLGCQQSQMMSRVIRERGEALGVDFCVSRERAKKKRDRERADEALAPMPTLAPTEVETTCRCSKWPFPHVHSDEDRQKSNRGKLPKDVAHSGACSHHANVC